MEKSSRVGFEFNFSIGAILAALAAVWGLAIRMLWNEWEIDPQYSYGFLVPLLCAVLFLKRWQDRPTPGLAENSTAMGVAALSFTGLLAALQPFYEANPEWRISGIVGAMCAVVLTLLLLQAIGGARWMRHFLFPVCFFLIAIPWPRNAEESIMGFFMERNAMAALEVLHWCGYEAVRRGHLIALPGGTLGVEEACSGVRSLQSGIMISLFLGEVFRFGGFIRVGLVSVSIAIALLGNFLRATALSIIASNAGFSAMEKWHDIAGLMILGATLGALWGLCLILEKLRRGVRSGLVAEHDPTPPPTCVPPKVAWACFFTALLCAGSLAGTELWYRAHETGMNASSRWTLKSGSAGTKPVPISDRTRRILFFPEGFSERFIDPAGRNWQFFYLRWPAGRTAVAALNIHDPRTCLASIGMVLERQLPSITIRVGEENFRFRVFLFREASRPVLVFHSIIAGGMTNSHSVPDEGNLNDEEYTLKGRWKAMTHGIRNRGQTLIEAAVWNTDDIPSAANSLAGFLARTLEATHPVKNE